MTQDFFGINVRCEDPGHPEGKQRVNIARFVAQPDGHWSIEMIGKFSPDVVLEQLVFTADGERIFTGDDRLSDPAHPGAHAKLRLRCRLCGTDLQRKYGGFDRVFDRLREAGVSDISLGALERMLG